MPRSILWESFSWANSLSQPGELPRTRWGSDGLKKCHHFDASSTRNWLLESAKVSTAIIKFEFHKVRQTGS